MDISGSIQFRTSLVRLVYNIYMDTQSHTLSTPVTGLGLVQKVVSTFTFVRLVVKIYEENQMMSVPLGW